MKALYDAANLIEAHMLQDLLKQEGFTTVLHGEYLQSGVGELPASGLVRITIEDEQYANARAFIEEWERENPPVAITPPAPQPHGSASKAYLTGAFLAGMVVTYLILRVPSWQNALDQNADGKTDEIWHYSSAGYVDSVETDRNFDGKIDSTSAFDMTGTVTSGKEDNDFNSTFETSYTYEFGQVASSEVDVDGDGKADRRYQFEGGALKTETYFDRRFGSAVQINRFELGARVSSTVDVNKDGVMDEVRQYDEAGEVASTAPVN